MKGALIHTDPLRTNTSNLSLDPSTSLAICCAFCPHQPLSLPRFWFPSSLTFLSCQHSQALIHIQRMLASTAPMCVDRNINGKCPGLVNAKSPMLRKREDKLAGREEESSFFGKIGQSKQILPKRS